MAYARIEPFGEERDDQRAGIIAATLANLFSDRKGKPPYTWEDFLRPKPAQPKPAQTWQQMLATVEMIAAARGDKDERTPSA